MEICQHCGMYMKPFVPSGKPFEGAEATCEFCGKPIAVVDRRDGGFYWKKLDALNSPKQ